MPRTLASQLLCLVFLGSGCIKRSFHPSKPWHSTLDSASSQAPWLWTSMERAEVRRAALGQPDAPEHASGEPDWFIPENHPTSQTARFWVEKIDAALRTRLPVELAQIPVPNVIVLADRAPQAYQTSASLCFPVEVSLGNLPLERTSDHYVTLNGKGTFQLTDNPPPCVSAHPFASQLPQIAKWLTANMGGKCIVTSDGTRIQLNNCSDLEAQFETWERPRGLAIPTAPNWLVVHSGLFTNSELPEPFQFTSGSPRFVAAIARELSRYYLAHHVQFPGRYDFWYLRSKSYSGVRPQPSQDTSLIAETRQALSIGINPQDVIDGQQLSPQMFVALRNILASNLAVRAKTRWSPVVRDHLKGLPGSCWTAFSLAASDGRKDYPFILNYPEIKPRSEAERQRFLEAESQFMLCAREVRIGVLGRRAHTTAAGQPADLAPKDVSIDAAIGNWVKDSEEPAGDLLRTRLKSLAELERNARRIDLSSINEALTRALPGTGCENQLPETATGYTLASLLFRVERRMGARTEQDLALADRVRRARVDLYTADEEAAALAVEILAQMGIPPQAALEQRYESLLLTERLAGHDPMRDHSPQECTSLHRASWTEPPLLGLVGGNIHGKCHSLFHVFEVMTTVGTLADRAAEEPLSWSDVAASARKYEDDTLPPPPETQGLACGLEIVPR